MQCGHYTALPIALWQILYCNDARITECNIITTCNSTVYILLLKLIVECHWQDRGGWESVNSHGAGTFVYPINYRSRNRPQNLWGGSAFPPDDLWFGLDTYTNYALIYNLHPGIQKFDWCGVPLVFICTEMSNWWGKGWPVVVCYFLALIVLYRLLSIVIQYEMSNVWVTVPTFVHLPIIFLSTDFLLERRLGAVTVDLLYITFAY